MKLGKHLSIYSIQLKIELAKDMRLGTLILCFFFKLIYLIGQINEVHSCMTFREQRALNKFLKIVEDLSSLVQKLRVTLMKCNKI